VRAACTPEGAGQDLRSGKAAGGLDIWGNTLYAFCCTLHQGRSVRIATLTWDDWNEDHVSGHGVSPQEVEEVCSTARKILRRGRAGTYVVFGRTVEGRELIVFLAARSPRAGTFYPITARPMNLRERRYFRARKGSE
jgi:uncharacterized DUF497 family protein